MHKESLLICNCNQETPLQSGQFRVYYSNTNNTFGYNYNIQGTIKPGRPYWITKKGRQITLKKFVYVKGDGTYLQCDGSASPLDFKTVTFKSIENNKTSGWMINLSLNDPGSSTTSDIHDFEHNMSLTFTTTLPLDGFV